MADDVAAELRDRVHRAVDAGVDKDHIIVDPGVGFSKNTIQSWTLLRRIEVVQDLGFPVLVGVSRKRLLTQVCGDEAGLVDRDLATAVVSALLASSGVDLLRVHDVAGTMVALRTAQQLRA